MENANQCPKCKSPHIYEDGNMWVCPECAHEWSVHVVAEAPQEEQGIKDAFGNLLATGDTVTVIKELRIKGSNSAVKVGTKVKNIRLVDAGDGHDIACKIDGIGSINLKSEFVKKV
ncbi:MAG: alkylphosphonate utilization protein [Bdellovibrionales bacterium]|nr:alkylphosphonate utilization protein [Bdellovibrionales bacterium]